MNGACSSLVPLVCALALAPALGAQQPDPLFGEVHRTLPKSIVNVFALDVGDVDGDGDVDAYLGNGQPSHADALLLNDGVGELTPGPDPANLDLDGTWAVRFGDLDGDGDLDAFLGREQRDVVLRNLGGASFEVLPGALPPDYDRAGAVALEDFDGDGDLDALVGNQYSLDRLLTNEGGGTFADASANLPQGGSSWAVATCDLDGDGDPDAVLGPPARVYLNQALTFTDASAGLPPLASLPVALALGDVDADGDLDLYLGNQSYTGLAQDALWLNDGLAGFSDASAQIPGGTTFTFSVAMADLDGDGDLDAYVGEEVDHLLLNDGAGHFASSDANLPPPPGARTLALGLADLDGDLDLDALLGKGLFSGRQSRLYLNRGDAVFADVTQEEPLPVIKDRSTDASWFDFEGDGDLDVVVANTFSGISGRPDRHRLLENDGFGRFEEPAADAFGTGGASADAVVAGDLDGDGDVDVVFGNNQYSYGWQNELYLNTGTVLFQLATGLPPASDQTEDAALGDFDEDGDLDLLFANGWDRHDRLLLNDGQALFSEESQRLPALHELTATLATGDVNADGHLDVALGSQYFGSDHLLLGDGQARFLVSRNALPDTGADTRCLRLFDADGDTDLDLYVGRYGQDALLLNGGRGHFVPALAGALPLEGEVPRWIETGDVDLDGDADLVVGLNPSYGGFHRLLVNDGAGAFADQSARLPRSFGDSFHVSLVDVDNDDDLDLFYANGNESTSDEDLEDELFTNRTRQLAWDAPPRLGKDLTLVIEGAAGTPWELYFSTGQALFELPPLGTVMLDPAGTHLVGSGVLDPEGRAEFTRHVPGSAALLGLTLYWQAAVGSPLHLTNLEATTFGGF